MNIKRSSGILLPISSLPSKYGIGTLGAEAYHFINYLVKADQTYWQVLPIGPTSYGDSPYQSFSSFAGNPYFIDLDLLVKDGLLQKKDLSALKVADPGRVDYGWLYNTRGEILRKAFGNKEMFARQTQAFYRENSSWLDDYALFMALKKHFGMVSWLEWPDEEIREKRPKAEERYRKQLKEEIEYQKFVQFLFYRQYMDLKEYANAHGIKIIGDLPIYTAMDSCDVWSDTKQFQLKENDKVPENVAGVPPDYFSKYGQLWGNPLYDWKYMKTTGYKWWIERVAGVAKFFDVIRIDHFRGFEEYWAVPYGDKDARNGHWEKGPSIDFVRVLRDWFADVEFIAEDLGIINEKVDELLKQSGFPGMRVLEFGTEADGSSYHCPHNQIRNCVCYVTTHDNVPIMGWFKTAKEKDLDYLNRYYGLNEEEGYNFGMIRGGMASSAVLFIAQMQDLLGLGEEATMNHPGTLGNWTWRLQKGQLDAKLAARLKKMTHTYGRSREK